MKQEQAWWESLTQNNESLSGTQYCLSREQIESLLAEQRQRMVEAIQAVKMPRWNGCYDERCKDRTCDLCKERAEQAEFDKQYVLSALKDMGEGKE